MRLWLVLALAQAFAVPVQAERREPPFMGHPDCATADRYFQAKVLADSARKKAESQNYKRALDLANEGISKLGFTYMPDDVPFIDDTGLHLAAASDLALHGRTKNAATTTIGVLDGRLSRYRQMWGDPAQLCPSNINTKELQLKRECGDKNIAWEVKPDGSRQPVGPTLSDGAEYVWRDGTCEVVGGLPATPNPK